MSLVQELGVGSWSHIAGQMKGRTDAWVNMILELTIRWPENGKDYPKREVHHLN
jgi:hypothetical protein